MESKEIELEQIARYLFTIRVGVLPQAQETIRSKTIAFKPDLLFIKDQTITIIEVKSAVIKLQKVCFSFQNVQDIINSLLDKYSTIRFIFFTDQRLTKVEKKRIFDCLHIKSKENRIKVEIWDHDIIKNELRSIDKSLGDLFELGHYGLIISYLQMRALERNFVKYTRLFALRSAVASIMARNIMARNITHHIGSRLLSPELLSIAPILMESLLQRHFSPKIAAKLAKDIDEGELKFESGKRYYNLIFLYADLKNFSKLINNTRDYNIIHALLNKFYSNVREIIFKYEGMFDKFIGDAVIAIFGFPYYDDNSAIMALKCAREIILTGFEIEKEWLKHIDIVPPEIGVRIGISVGDGIVVKTGNEISIFSEITIISNELNLAARLEEKAPVNGIRMSNRYYNMLDDIQKKHLESEEIEIKGFNEKILTWIERNSLDYLII